MGETLGHSRLTRTFDCVFNNIKTPHEGEHANQLDKSKPGRQRKGKIGACRITGNGQILHRLPGKYPARISCRIHRIETTNTKQGAEDRVSALTSTDEASAN